MQIESTALSDVGLQRDHNEDACLADDVHDLDVVADGMGGAAAGEVECFAGTPAMLQATAMTPTLVLTFKRAHLEQAGLRDPGMGVHFVDARRRSDRDRHGWSCDAVR